MTFLGLFGSKTLDLEDYERQLLNLSRDIVKVRNHITILKRKRASFRSSAILYLTVAYVATVAYRYRTATTGIGLLSAGQTTWQLFLNCLLARDFTIAFASPFAIAAFVYVVDSLFKFWIHNKERSLRSLMRRDRETLEDLKLKTNFSKTSLLLQRFDWAGTSSVQKPEVAPTNKTAPALLAQSANNANPNTSVTAPKNAAGGTIKSDNASGAGENGIRVSETQLHNTAPAAAALEGAQLPTSPVGARSNGSPAGWAPPIKKTLQDRILDFIIGSEHNEAVESRYALICARCYTHNGLAPPGSTDPSTMVYICRNCSFMNSSVGLHSADKAVGHARNGSMSPEEHKTAERPETEKAEKAQEMINGGSESDG